jgi:hypothetical protein
MDKRGQTPQDFAIGTSLMLITIIGTFAFIQGGAVTTFTDEVDGADTEAATRLAGVIIEEYSDPAGSNELDAATMDTDLSSNFAALKERSGLVVEGDRNRDHQAAVLIVNSSSLRNGTVRPANDHPTTAGKRGQQPSSAR